MKKILLLCILALFFCACSKKDEPKNSPKTVDLGEVTADEQDADADNAENEPRNIKAKRAQADDSEKADAKDASPKKKGVREARKGDKPYRGRQAAAEKPEETPEPAAEAFDFSDDEKDEVAAKAPANPEPRMPKVRQGMSIEKLINIREFREKTGYSGALSEDWLLGQNPDQKYNAMRISPDNDKDLGFSIQVWKPGNESAAAKRFEDLFKQSFGGQKVKQLANDAFSSNHHKLNELAFFERSKRATVLLSCSESICSMDQLKEIAMSIQRRL
ncbi:MAG: hypothetical protein IKY83_09915 [Proteobacteria bacterium]|nr:hypothetical protein [Pseudomonadota bacterium]